MAAVIVLLAAGLVVVSTVTYNYLLSKKIKVWLCSVLRGAAFFPANTVRAGAAAKVKKEVVTMALGRAELEDVFATFDKNGDGYITAAELEESLRKLGLSVTREEVTSMVEKLDANGDGLLDLQEFWELYNSVGAGTAAKKSEAAGAGGESITIEREDEFEEDEGDLKEAFDVFDGNGDGLITGEELGMVLAALGLAPGVTAARCSDMIKRVDVDGDGKVSFEEFKRMMRGANKDRKFF